MAEILAEEASRAEKRKAGDAARDDAARRSGAQSQTASIGSEKKKASGGSGNGSGSGSFADLLRGGGGSRGGGATAGWAVRSADSNAPSGLQTPAPPRLPKVTPESLALEARRSKIDGFGKIRCLVCGRMFKSYGPLEQHLAASHFGLNSSQAKALEAALLASGRSLPGDGSQKTKPDRVAVQLGQILEQPRRGDGVASLAASLSAYIKEAKPSKADRRAAAASASGPKGKGKMMINPNQAMSSGMVMRRGKEREGPKKKKRPTKLKRIILTARAAREEARAEKEASEAAEANGGEAERGGDEADDREVEVTVEVGRVYVNLLFDRAEAEGGDAGRVGVDLIYLEDEDEDDDDERTRRTTGRSARRRRRTRRKRRSTRRRMRTTNPPRRRRRRTFPMAPRRNPPPPRTPSRAPCLSPRTPGPSPAGSRTRFSARRQRMRRRAAPPTRPRRRSGSRRRRARPATARGRRARRACARRAACRAPATTRGRTT
jgi:hypothetical protein